MALSLQVNGQSKSFDTLAPGASVFDLVQVLDLKEDRIALEHNGNIVPRGSRAGVTLADGDKLEIVHFVGGGR